VQSLIISEVALPLPPDFDLVADCMEWWGRCISAQWYIVVLKLFKEYLTPGGFHDAGPTKERLFHDCIFQLVLKKFHDHYGFSERTFELLSHWEALFQRLYFHCSRDFFDIAVSSIRETDFLLERTTTGAPSCGRVVAPTVISLD
jgi:hypothetical protein